MLKRAQNIKLSNGFTIIELLVVIVVIGVLATITVIGYVGITQRATAATLQTDLKSASTQLALYKAEHETYPPEGSGEISSLPTSDGTVYQYSVIGDDYYLSATAPSSGITSYHTSSELGGTISSGVWLGHTPPPGTPLTWIKISVAEFTSHTCGIASDNKAYCWGSNSNGQLGNNSTSQSNVPVAVNTSGLLSGKTIKEISSAMGHSCVIASDDKAYCWGSNNNGKLGNNSTTQSLVPVAVDTTGVLSSKTVKSITTSNNGTCVIASDDKAYCWGLNSSGQLGNNSTTQSLVPVAVYTSGVLSGKTMKQISMGSSHTCGIASDNQAYCWGADNNGRLGNNLATSPQSLVPVAVTRTGALSGKTVKSIELGLNNACVIASDNLPYCWGYNLEYELGDGTTSPRFVPTAVTMTGALSGKTVLSITSGNIHTCVIASDNKPYCWGYNSQGMLGTGNTTNSSTPIATDVSGALSGKSLASISAGAHVTCSLDTDGQAYCWGYGNYGALGNGLTSNNLTAGLVNQLVTQ